LLDLVGLPRADYRATAELLAPADDAVLQQAEFRFRTTDKRRAVGRIPTEGILIEVEATPDLPDGRWPVRCGVPLPYGAIDDANQLLLFEDGRPVACEVRPRARWSPNGSLKWVHLDFQARYTAGRPARYVLTTSAARTPPAEPPLTVREDSDAILIDTGYVRFSINRRRFAGIDEAWFDATGRSRYQLDHPLVAKSPIAGPFLVDERDRRYSSAADDAVEVQVEEQGPVRAVIVARGWYRNATGERLCKFTTRIRAYAGQPFVRIDHQTYITFDTHQRQLGDLGFHLPIAGPTHFEVGTDGATLEGPLPNAPAPGYLHQDRWDHCRVVTAEKSSDARQADGWAELRSADVAVSAALKHIWQKYPKEIEFSREGMTLHFWPRHGGDTFRDDEELRLDNIYKFLCFHEGKRMNLSTPEKYIAAFDAYAKSAAGRSGKEGSSNWWRDTERDGTRSGNAQGRIISNEFALLFRATQDAPNSPLPANAGAFARLFQDDPTAYAAPQWNCSTDALMPMAPADPHLFPEMEQAVLEGFLSWTRSVERYHDYGMWNYADTQSIAVVAENRPGLHRIWQGSHYHNVGTGWIMWYRTADRRALRWARDNTDHYMNIQTVNYVDEAHPVPQRDHELGAMQHMGWKTHWGSATAREAWGQCADVVGHFIDPDAYLWCWYLTGNERAWEAYTTWAQAVEERIKSQLFPAARETINTLSYSIACYQATWRPQLLATILATSRSLRATPLELQQPGPLFHPWWLLRVYDQTRDPDYADWIVHYAHELPPDAGVWPLELAAKSYELNGKTDVFRPALARMRTWPRTFLRVPNEKDAAHRWDWFGNGPGPLGDSYAYMSWGLFAKALHEAGIRQIPADITAANSYPFATAQGAKPTDEPSLIVYALEPTDRTFSVNYGLRGMIADLPATSVDVLWPRGTVVQHVARLGHNGDKNRKHEVPSDGAKGLYRIEFRGNEAVVPAPQTSLPHEAALMHPFIPYRVTNARLYVEPFGTVKTFNLVVRAESSEHATDFIVRDGNGGLVGRGSLLADIAGHTEASLHLDPVRHPLPWLLDIVSPRAAVTCQGVGYLVLSESAESLQVITQELHAALKK
jgi:hypothetical protein